MNRKFFTLFAFICLIFPAIDLVTSQKLTNRLLQSLDIRKNEIEKIYQFESYLSQLKDAETGQRGFVITGDVDYLKPYQSALDYFQSKDVEDFIAQEKSNSNAKLAEDISELERLKNLKLDQLKFTIEQRKNQSFEDAKIAVIKNHDKKTMDSARKIVASIIQDKEKKIDSLDEEVAQATKNALLQNYISNIIGSILFLACIIYVFRYIQKLDKKDQELSKALQQLNESLAMRQAILNSINYAIISTDPQGLITSFNPAAEKMLGYSAKEIVGKYSPEIFHEKKEMEERAFALFNQLQKKIPPNFEVFVTLAKQNISDINEWTYIRKDGTRFPVQLSVTAIRNGSQITGFVGIVYDITERKQFDRIKDEIMNLTSIELREPVAAIKGCLDLLSLESHLLSEKTRHLLEIGKVNCDHLVNLTGDMLAIQRIETGKVNFNFKEIDLSSFIAQAVKNHASLALQSHISLICQFTESQCFVKADENQLMQAMNRLISNAIKETPQEGTVEIAGQKMDAKVRIEIKDQSSIDSGKSSFNNIQKFGQGTFSNPQKKVTGLGLNIVKSIIEKHQGMVGFQTSSNGMILWFELPLSE